MSDNRIYGENVDIDKKSVQQVFENVAKKATSPLGSCMLDMKDQYAYERHQEEVERLLNFFPNDYTVLDIGCGIGRHRETFATSNYHGIDFCNEYIRIAKERMFELEDTMSFIPHGTIFDCMTISDMIGQYAYIDSKLYDLVISCGVLMYLSDADIVQLLKWLKQSKKQFYIRESISLLDKRLTLKEFPSDDLGISYSAIYRTREEYVKLFQSVFGKECYINVSKLLQPLDKQIRKETNQVYFTWEA